MSSFHVSTTKPARLQRDFHANWDIDPDYKPVKKDDDVIKNFQSLADNIATTDWRSSDWYRAGYEDGKNSK
jgi:hypothetical protein